MQYPLVLSSHRRIVIAPQGWFDAIGRLDAGRGELEIGINHLGEGGLAWHLRGDLQALPGRAVIDEAFMRGYLGA